MSAPTSTKARPAAADLANPTYAGVSHPIRSALPGSAIGKLPPLRLMTILDDFERSFVPQVGPFGDTVPLGTASCGENWTVGGNLGGVTPPGAQLGCVHEVFDSCGYIVVDDASGVGSNSWASALPMPPGVGDGTSQIFTFQFFVPQGDFSGGDSPMVFFEIFADSVFGSGVSAEAATSFDAAKLFIGGTVGVNGPYGASTMLLIVNDPIGDTGDAFVVSVADPLTLTTNNRVSAPFGADHYHNAQIWFDPTAPGYVRARCWRSGSYIPDWQVSLPWGGGTLDPDVIGLAVGLETTVGEATATVEFPMIYMSEID